MKKNTILYVLIVCLIIFNLFFVFTYMNTSNDDRPDRPNKNIDFIVKELGFNTSQLETFNEKSKGHHQKMIRWSNDIKGLKDSLFKTLSDDSVDEATIDSISALICVKETQKDKEVYYHFKMIREIADDKQKEKFETILMDAMRQGYRGNRPPPPNGEEGHRPPPPNGEEGRRPPPRRD